MTRPVDADWPYLRPNPRDTGHWIVYAAGYSLPQLVASLKVIEHAHEGFTTTEKFNMALTMYAKMLRATVEGLEEVYQTEYRTAVQQHKQILSEYDAQQEGD